MRKQNYTFSQVPKADIPRSTFNRSHGHKTTFDAGYVIPVLTDEILPGDTVELDANFFARLATPITPIMDEMYLDYFHFFVPMRLLWENWERFNGARDNPDDSIDYLIPSLSLPEGIQAPTQSLYDYMGIPTYVGFRSDERISALPFRAYNLIWNEWFRDQNLQLAAPKNMGDGPDAVTDYMLLRRGKRHDYFTSALPWPQKGEGVNLPLGGRADVKPLNTLPGQTPYPTFKFRNDPIGFGGAPFYINGQPGDNTVRFVFTSDNDQITWEEPGLYADLSDATATTINSLRQAFQLQKLLERDARGGTRYIEILKSHFGVTSPDYRLQRPEYLGGGSTPININPVAQTSNTVTNSPQGNLAAFGTVATRPEGFKKSFVEHGYLITLVSVRADLNYQQGIPKHFLRRTRYDYYLPVLSHLGEQAVLNKELYHAYVAGGTPETDPDNQVFGYQERWAEYRYHPNRISGKFRSSDPQSLDIWHLAQDFATRPTLSAQFIEENPPIDRVIAVPSEPHFIFDSFFNMKTTRVMPLYSVPGLIDHF